MPAGPRHPSAASAGNAPEAFAAPPPRVIARPAPRPGGGVIVSWSLGGIEAAPTAAAGTISKELLARPTLFALENQVGQFITRRPVDRVRLEIRSLVSGATHVLVIARGAQGRLTWAVDGRPLTGVETPAGAPYPALPSAVFGEYLRIENVNPASGAAPNVVINW